MEKTGKNIDLGVMSYEGDIQLPLLALETGNYLFKYRSRSVNDTKSIPVVFGEKITIPNLFQENDMVVCKFKRPNNILFRKDGYTTFSFLIEKDDGQVNQEPSNLYTNQKTFAGVYEVLIEFEEGKKIFFEIGNLILYVRDIVSKPTYLKLIFDFPVTGKVNYLLT